MKHLVSSVLAALTFLAVPAHAQDAAAIASAQAAASAWLALTDAGQYTQSWEQAAGLFQASVSKTHWQSALQNVRLPLGKLKSRHLKSAKFTRSLPGAPDGEYVVIQYESQFENMPAALETVTPLREKDGSWKVSGYFISPTR
jgi:hypothetical protein